MAPVDLRVLTYNVHGLRAGIGTVSDVVRAAAPDVACLQEGPHLLRWRSRAAELARRAGLYVVTGGRPAEGNLLLCSARVDLVTASSVLLSRTPGMPQRGLTAAVLEVTGTRFGVIGAHLGLRASERARHATEIADVADRLRADGAGEVMLAGDLNASWTAGEWEPLRAAFADTAGADATWHTYPARAPQHRIDVVLAAPEVTVSSCGVPEEVAAADLAKASDHHPVVAVLRLG